MKKPITTYLATLSFIFALISHQPLHADESRDTFSDFLRGFKEFLFNFEKFTEATKNHCISVDTDTIRKNITDKIDRMCQIHHQSDYDQEKIHALKSDVTRAIAARTYTMCYSFQAEAQQDCDNDAKRLVVQYISRLAQQYALEEAKNWYHHPPVNPIYVNKLNIHEFASSVAKQIELEVKQQYEQNYSGSLQHYWGDTLQNKIMIIAQHKFQRSTPLPELCVIDLTNIEFDMMNRIDRLCATSEQTPAKQQIINQIKQKACEQLMYDMRHKHYNSHQEAQADAIQKLNSFLPVILQDYASNAQKDYVKQRAIEALERNAPNALKFLISDQLN